MDTCCLFEWVVFGHNPKFVGYYENQVNIIGFLLKSGYGDYISWHLLYCIILWDNMFQCRFTKQKVYDNSLSEVPYPRPYITSTKKDEWLLGNIVFRCVTLAYAAFGWLWSCNSLPV